MSVKTMKPLEAMKRDATLPNIPQQLQIKNIVSDQNVMVETEILDPITHNQTTSKFILPNKGVLDARNSRLVWSLTNPATNGSIMRPTNVVGGLGFIKSLRLSIGGNEVSFINDLNHYSVCKKQFKSLDNQKYRGEAFLKNNNDIVYATEGGGDRWFMPTNLGDEKSTNSVVGKSLTNDVNTTPKYAESLADLLPFFSKGNQLPLFLSNQEVVLDIEWDTDQNAVIFDDETKKDTPIVQTPTLMLDLMYYGEDVVELLRENNNKNGLNFEYNDIMLITNNMGNGINEKNFYLGMSERVVDRMWIQNDDKGNDSIGMGKFRSVVDDGSEWNIRVNERMIFDKNIDQRGMEYSYMCDTTKKPFNSVLGQFQGGNNTYCGNGTGGTAVSTIANLTTNTAEYNFSTATGGGATFSNPDLPAIVFSGGGLGLGGVSAVANLKATATGITFKVGEEITITEEGDAITNIGTATLLDNQGGGTATAPTFTPTIVGGKLTRLVVATAGSGGYTGIPTLDFVGNVSTTTPLVVCDLTNFQQKPENDVDITNNGVGYASAPTIALNPPNAGTILGAVGMTNPVNSNQTLINVESCLKGTMNYLGVDLTTYNNTDGIRVGANPIEFITKRTSGGDRLKRWWVSYKKQFSMVNGKVIIDQQ